MLSQEEYSQQVRQEQWEAQIAALSCEVALHVIRKGIKNAIVNLRGKPKTKYEYNQERKRDVRQTKGIKKEKTKYQIMYEVDEDPCGPAYKTLDVDPSLFTRNYQQPSFTHSLKVIHPTFANFKILERIDISNQLIGDSGVESLCSAIRGAPVKTMNLSGNHITDVGIRHLVSILRSLHNLVCLSLSRNAFGDQGISLLSDRQLYHSGTIAQYDFTYNNFTPLAGYYLGTLFLGDSQAFCPIQHLRLGGNISHRVSMWGDVFLKQFLSPLLQSPNVQCLKILHLTDFSLTDVGIQCVAGFLLCDKCGLEELSLSKCFFSPEAKELLTRTFLQTRRRLQLFAQDCGVSVKELNFWQQELLYASPEQKYRLQRTMLRYEMSLHCAAVTQQALLSCHVAQYYLRQQISNSWTIETPARWQTNPMMHEKAKLVHNLADETGVQIESTAPAPRPTGSPGGPSSPGSAGILRKQMSSVQRQSSVKASPSASLTQHQPSSTGGPRPSTRSPTGDPVNTTVTSSSVRPSSPSISLPTLSKTASFAAAVADLQSHQLHRPQQQIVIINAASAKTQNTFNTATFVDSELLRQESVQRDPLCRMLARRLVALMEQASFVHFLQEVLAFMVSQSFHQQELPTEENVPLLAQPARTELVDIQAELRQLEALRVLRLPRWNAAVDAIILEGKDFLRVREQEQAAALTLADAEKKRLRQQKLFMLSQQLDASPSRKPDADGPMRLSTSSPVEGHGPQPVVTRTSRQKASVRLVKVLNDERMERLFMMQEDAWSHTIEEDRIDSSMIGLKYHFRLLNFALVQMISALHFQQQGQQHQNRLTRQHKKSSSNSLRNLSSSNNNNSPKHVDGSGGGHNASYHSFKQSSSSVGSSFLPPISGRSVTGSESLASARSDTSVTSSSKKQQRQTIAAERARQQQMQSIVAEGREYHRNLVRRAVPCANTLGSLGFFLYYLHTVYGKEVEAAASNNRT